MNRHHSVQIKHNIKRSKYAICFFNEYQEFVSVTNVEAFRRDENFFEVTLLLNAKQTTAQRWQANGVVVNKRAVLEKPEKSGQKNERSNNCCSGTTCRFYLDSYQCPPSAKTSSEARISISKLADMLCGQLIAIKNKRTPR